MDRLRSSRRFGVGTPQGRSPFRDGNDYVGRYYDRVPEDVRRHHGQCRRLVTTNCSNKQITDRGEGLTLEVRPSYSRDFYTVSPEDDIPPIHLFTGVDETRLGW